MGFNLKTFMVYVKAYKFLGMSIWALVSWIFFGLINRRILLKIDENDVNQYIFSVSFLIQLPCLATYFSCIHPAPIRASVLPLSSLFQRIIFIFALVAWLFSIAFAYVQKKSGPKEAAIYSLIVSFVTVMTNKFTIVYSFRKRSRISQVFRSWNVPLIAPTVISIVICIINKEDRIVRILMVFTLFLASSFSLTIVAVIAGERTSFASSDGALLSSGLSSIDPYTHFLAFVDLYEISGGPSSRREFIFRDPSRRRMNELTRNCNATINALLQQHMQLQKYRGNSIPASQVSNSYIRRAALDATHVPRSTRENFIQKFLRQRREKAMKERRESFAVQATVTAMYAAQSLVRIVALMPTEDKLGVGQASMDQMMMMFVNAKHVLSRSEGYHWAMKSFGKNWVAKNPADLTRQALNIFNWAISELSSRHVPIPSPTI